MLCKLGDDTAITMMRRAGLQQVSLPDAKAQGLTNRSHFHHGAVGADSIPYDLLLTPLAADSIQALVSALLRETLRETHTHTHTGSHVGYEVQWE